MSPEDLKSQACANAVEAVYLVHEEIKGMLRSPSTATFPSPYDASTHDVSPCVIEVHTYVDAQNAFGAMIRERYMARVEITGATPNRHFQYRWAMPPLTEHLAISCAFYLTSASPGLS